MPFTDTERQILEAIAATAIPAGEILPGAGETAAQRLEAFLEPRHPAVKKTFTAVFHALDKGALWRYRRPFRRLSPEKRLQYLTSLGEGGYALRTLLRVLLIPVKLSHFSDPAIFDAVGCEYTPPRVRVMPPRWQERIVDGAALAADVTVEAEVVVVGTGAGGAVVAKELAAGARAVVMLEEGRYHSRADFTGNRVEQTEKLYRDFGLTASVGNTVIMLPMGRCVGGSTTINAGTCFRIPEWILERWRSEHGLERFTPEQLEPYYRRVETTLQVAEVRPELLGGMARVIARGCEALGYHHGPLARNAPDCEGKGFCCFGCPTGAKRSTDVSYVPLALSHGAMLYTSARADRILIERGRAVGVTASCRGPDGQSRRLTVRAPIVVLACGSLLSPLLMWQSGCGRANPHLGRNLSVHPASSALALFDEPIEGYKAVPQGYAVDELHREGILLEGGFTPLDYLTLTVPIFGPRLTHLMEHYRQVTNFGFMISDTSRGRVSRGLGGRPLVTYFMNDRDTALLKRSLTVLCEIYLAAGARKIFPLLHGFDEISSTADLDRLRHAPLKARHFELMAFHPLGTARMGSDPARSVVDEHQQSHEIANLFIADGSAVPSAVGVNPQVAIMTLATMTADHIEQRLHAGV